VENSVKYGFLENNIRGMITISAQIDMDSIVFSITDNGKGMSKETIQEIESMKGSPSGILNVIHRLKLAYGDKYSMTITSKENKFTKVVVRIPKEEIEC
jgi:two-component system sensor histidine kinase YesM